MTPRPSARLGLSALLLVLGCDGHELAGRRIITDTLDIHHQSAWALCQGTVQQLSDAVIQSRARFQLPPAGPRVRLDTGTAAVQAHCDSQGGCAWGFGPDARAAAVLGSALHEIVHVTRRQHGLRGPPVFEEAIAVILEGDAVPFDVTIDLSLTGAPSRTITKAREELTTQEVLSAVHFLGFLMEASGSDDLVFRFFGTDAFDVDTSIESFEARFETTFGFDLATAENQWTTSDPYRSFGRWCTPPNTRVLPESGLTYEGMLACDDDDVRGVFELSSDDGRAERSLGCLELNADQDLRVRGTGTDSISLTLEPEWCPPEASASDSTPKTVWIPSDEVLRFGGCRYRVRVSAHYFSVGEEYMAPTYSVSLVPS